MNRLLKFLDGIFVDIRNFLYEASAVALGLCLIVSGLCFATYIEHEDNLITLKNSKSLWHIAIYCFYALMIPTTIDLIKFLCRYFSRKWVVAGRPPSPVVSTPPPVEQEKKKSKKEIHKTRYDLISQDKL